MKKSTIISVVLIIAAFLIGYGIGQNQGVKKEETVGEGQPSKEEAVKDTKEERRIKIGAILPLTGNSARYGEWEKNGINLAVEEINNSGGINGRKLIVVYEDDQCQQKSGVNAINKLIRIDQVPIIIGPWCSSVALAIAPIAESSKVVLFTHVTTPKISEAGDYIFRISLRTPIHTMKLATFAYDKLNARRASILYVNNDQGVGYREYFSKDFSELGGRINIIEVYEQDATDFRTQLSKIKESNPDVVLSSSYKEYGLIMKQAREIGINQPFLAHITFESPDVLEVAQNAAENVFYVYDSWSVDNKTQTVQDYRNKYKKKYGVEPEIFSAQGYDSIQLTSKAMKKCAEDPICIKEELYKVKNYSGAISANLSSDINGDFDRDVIIKTVKNGQFVPYEK